MSLAISTYYAGTAVQTQVTFTNPGSSTPVDPSTITLKFSVYGTGGGTITWVYQGAGSITKSSTGVYAAVLPNTVAGQVTVEWIGTGTCAAVGVSNFTTLAPPL